MGFRTRTLFLLFFLAGSAMSQKMEVGKDKLTGWIQLMNPADKTLKIEGMAKDVDATNYLAFAISKDKLMGEDIAFVCSTSGMPMVMKIRELLNTKKVEPRPSALVQGQEVTGAAATYDTASKTLKCSIEIPEEIMLFDGSYNFKLKEKELGLLIATGEMIRGENGTSSLFKHTMKDSAMFNYGNPAAVIKTTTTTNLLLAIIAFMAVVPSLLNY